MVQPLVLQRVARGAHDVLLPPQGWRNRAAATCGQGLIAHRSNRILWRARPRHSQRPAVSFHPDLTRFPDCNAGRPAARDCKSSVSLRQGDVRVDAGMMPSKPRIPMHETIHSIALPRLRSPAATTARRAARFQLGVAGRRVDEAIDTAGKPARREARARRDRAGLRGRPSTPRTRTPRTPRGSSLSGSTRRGAVRVLGYRVRSSVT